MNLEQLEKLKKVKKEDVKVNLLEKLVNHEDRTLLFGYTCDREDFHVYIKDGVIYKRFGGNRKAEAKEFDVSIVDYTDLEYLVPNKRLYPQYCDYEFCELLVSLHVTMPFTIYEEGNKEGPFYGGVSS